MTAENKPRPNVTATFPSDSRFAGFELRIERPRDEHGGEALDRGWDILYEKPDGSEAYNHWADTWDQVLLYFAKSAPPEAGPPWVDVGKFRDAVFPP